MSLSVESNKTSAQGNGATVAFPFSFKVYDSGDLLVYLVGEDGSLTLKTISTHYSVSLNSGEGGTVTFLSAPENTEDVLLIRASTFDQDTDLETEDDFSEADIETRFDKLTTFDQELKEKVDRSIKVTLGSAFTSASAVELNAIGNGGKVVGLNEAETAFEWLTASEFFDIAEGSISSQMEDTLGNGQSATALAEFAIDSADYTSGLLFCEIRRTTNSVTVVSFALFWLSYVSSAWEIADSLVINRSGVAHGVTLTINTASGIGTVSAATTTLAGTGHVGSINGKMLRFVA